MAFVDLKNESLLPKIDISSLNEVRISDALKSCIQHMFETSGDVDNVKIMDFTSSIHVKKSGNTVIFPNQYFMIAACYFEYAITLVNYFSFFDKKIRDNKELERIIYEKDFDLLPTELFEEQNDRVLFINFLQSLGKDFVNKDNNSVKSRPTIDVFGSCMLNKISVPNASSSILGETIYYLSTNADVYIKLRNELIKENVLYTTDNAVGFLLFVLKKTLNVDTDFSLMADKFETTETYLTLNTFRFGRNKSNPPNRSSDWDPSISWKYKEKEYSSNKEITPKEMIDKFFPQYNESYRKRFRLVERNGKYSMLDLKKDQLIYERKESVSLTKASAQTIFYGVPGCGKSHSVDKIINNAITEFNKGKDSECQITYDKQVIRTVFHPDYCNADFVGQIMPKKKGNGIDYEFKPGPLATIIRKAYLNPSKPYFLIIEEINRGNASAIFGETFQLLDRYKNGKHSSEEEIRNENYDYTEGWSKYSINNDDLNGFILLGGESNVTEKEPGVDYESDSSETPKSAIKIPSIGLHFSTYSGIRLPPNLSLYATMNTSDQNVFTLDNAFQRRWEMKQVSNELKNDDEHPVEKIQYNQLIGDTGVKWGEFRKKINEIIMQSADENGLSSMEDKRLGGWFITPKKDPEAGENVEPVITKKAFAEKVLKYLWDDAFKFDRKVHFDNSYKTLEDLINAFVGGEGFKVFTDTSINGPKQEASTDEPAATES